MAASAFALVRFWRPTVTVGQEGRRFMKNMLVTGSNGLIGSEMVRHFHGLGWQVHGVDNNMRADFFGPAGDTR